MKRSEINKALKELEAMCEKYCRKLPTSAENSPNECPAVISGLKSSPIQRAEITEI